MKIEDGEYTIEIRPNGKWPLTTDERVLRSLGETVEEKTNYALRITSGKHVLHDEPQCSSTEGFCQHKAARLVKEFRRKQSEAVEAAKQ